MNLDISMEHVLSLIHNDETDPNKLSEVIDPEIELLLDSLNINDFADFVNDHELVFSKYLN